MTLIERLPEGSLYFYEEFSVAIWVVVGIESVMVAYHEPWESFEQVVTRVRHWHKHLEADNSRNLEGDECHLVYAARKNQASGDVITVRFVPGDWMGLLLHRLPKHRDQLPSGWPEVLRLRIRDLQSQRTDGAAGERGVSRSRPKSCQGARGLA
jgi:hypothetical protein